MALREGTCLPCLASGLVALAILVFVVWFFVA